MVEHITADLNRRTDGGGVKVSLRRFQSTPEIGMSVILVDGEEQCPGRVIAVHEADRTVDVQMQWSKLKIVPESAEIGESSAGDTDDTGDTAIHNESGVGDQDHEEATEKATDQDAPATNDPTPMSMKKKVWLLVGGFVLTVGAATGAAWLIEGPIKEWRADHELHAVFENRSDIELKSASVHEHNDAEGTPQRALGRDGSVLSSAQFIFGPAGNSDTEPLDIVVSFGEQKSMDFLRLNSDSLQGLMTNNVAEVRVHTAPASNNPYSILAAEGLALAVEDQPDADHWMTIMSLIGLSVALADEQETDPQVMAERIAETLQGSGFNVSANDIQQGSYAEWIHAASSGIRDDSHGLPIIRFGGTRVDPGSVNIMNPEHFSDHIWSRSMQG